MISWVVYNIMISLEIAISNFKSYNYQDEPTADISLRFGEISTTLSLSAGEAGKCLYLNLSPQQLQDIYLHYACGLFILNRSSKFFSLLSFERVSIEDRIICNEITFVNDLREAKYHCQFSMVAKGYKAPRIADTAKLEARENALNMLKKPPVHKQTPQFHKEKEAKPKQEIQSFLYGKVAPPSDNLQTLKQDLRKTSQTRASLQKAKYPQVSKAAMAKQPQQLDEDDPFDSNPPMMQFTNEQPQDHQPMKVPQINYMSYEDSMERSRNSQKRIQQTPSNFQTFNRNQNPQRQPSPETPTQFQLKSSKGLPPRASYTKEEIKEMARQQAEARKAKENVMIPIARGDKFQLLPLSALKPQEIIDFVQRQRRNEEEAMAFEQRKRKLQERERQLQQKNRKLLAATQRREADRDREPLVMVRRPSKQIRQSVHKQIKEQAQDEQQHNDDDYMSDFQSMSASNSIIRSRISSRGNARNNVSKEEESVLEDEYSQEFDSYSHSMLSKTNPKKDSQSVSDYSESYRSITNSYKK